MGFMSSSNRIESNPSKFNTAQAMVEFLIILPVMLLLVMGILQFAFIYQAKTTLNYAAFHTVRAGSLNNLSMSAMEMAFASNMAPLYTSSYFEIDTSDNCSSTFLNYTLPDGTNPGRQARLSGIQIMDSNTRGILDANIDNFNSDSVICARRIVQEQIADGYVNITVVNPSTNAFTDFGVDIDVDGSTETAIPNDNLMYRDSTLVGGGLSSQSIQDANLLKIHVGYCFELIVPFVDRVIWSLHALSGGPDIESKRTGVATTHDSAYFGTPTAGSFAESCMNATDDIGDQRYSIVLYSQGIMRMQSAAIECKMLDSSDPLSC